MKLNKQILEAINRGIKLALDDFEDNEVQNQEPILSKKKVQNYDAKDDFDFYNSFVDLGLPSGTLWAKYNLGANINKIIEIFKYITPAGKIKPNIAKTVNPEIFYGNYYAWGETEYKEYYDREHYKFTFNKPITTNGISIKAISKYNNNDKLKFLLLGDDAAYKNDSRLKIPTFNQFIELYDNTTWKWQKNYLNIKDLNGVVFTSKINENKIFFPAAGLSSVHYNAYQKTNTPTINFDKFNGYYWTNELYNDDEAYSFFLQNNMVMSETQNLRFLSLQIKPVLNK